MSLLNKDDVIKACADAYRTASGTTDPVPVGDLAGLISALTAGGGGGASNLYIGQYTPTSDSNYVTVTHNLGTTDILLAAIFAESFEGVELTSQVAAAQVIINTPYPQHGTSSFSTEKNIVSNVYYDYSTQKAKMSSVSSSAYIPDITNENTIKFKQAGSSANKYASGVTYKVIVVASEEVSV